MKLYITLLAFFSQFTIGCGVDLTGEKFSDEKDQRIEAEQKLNESKSEAEVVELLFSSVTQTATMQWAYISNRLGSPFETYEKAEALCQSIGFDLPSVEMMEKEGKTVVSISSLGSTDKQLNETIYIKNEPAETIRFLVCARQTPAVK
jgi:hypothetical protein